MIILSFLLILLGSVGPGILFASACQFSGAFVKVDVVVAVVANMSLVVYWLAIGPYLLLLL